MRCRRGAQQCALLIRVLEVSAKGALLCAPTMRMPSKFAFPIGRVLDAQFPPRRIMIRTINVTRYITPLREGGSLPAIVEGDDDGTYVLKFRGAGQGAKALIAELISGEIARVLGLRVPEIVLVNLDAVLGRSEPDYEIRSLLKASDGLNLALDYLPGSMTFDSLLPRVAMQEPDLASKIVWFDALVTNIDRTPRNTNLLVWHHQLWLIDHGASLYFHHGSDDFLSRATAAFPQIKDHVLLTFADKIREVDEVLAAQLTPRVLEAIINLVPDAWLQEHTSVDSPTLRAAYVAYFLARLQSPRLWAETAIEEANNVRTR